MSNFTRGRADRKKIRLVRDFLDEIEKEGITREEAISIIRKEAKSLPVTIFNSELSPLQAAVKYLYENRGMRYHEISELLNRDHRTIWNTYRNAIRAYPGYFSIAETRYAIPLRIFSDRTLSFLEHICSYLLAAHSLSFHQIGVLLGKDDRTVWTVCKRAERKHGK